MNLILHQAMTDIRAQRWLVAAWAAMLAAACAIETLTLAESLALPLLAIAAGRVVLGWVLAVRIIHADPPDDDSAFWLTRPVSRRMLLGAKGGLILVLLLGVPGASALLVFVLNGIGIRSLPGIFAQWLLIESLPLLPIVLIAALTRDVARLVLALLLGLFSWWVLQASCWSWWNLTVEFGTAMAWQSRVVRAWQVVGTGVVVLCAVLTARQYLTRRTGSIAFAALVAALGILAIAALWPIQLMVNRPSWDEASVEPTSPEWRGAGGISAVIPEESLRLLPWPFPLHRLVGDLHVDGLGDGVILRTAGGRGTLRFLEGGQVLERQRPWAFGFGFGLASLEDAACRRNFERMLGARLIDPFSSELNGLRLVDFKPGVYAAHEGGRAAYDAILVFDADRVEAAAVIPLKVGASAHLGQVSETLIDIHWVEKPPRWVIDVRRVVPRILPAGDGFRIVPFLRNRKRGEAMVLSGDSAGTKWRALSATAVAVRRVSYVPNYGVAPRGVSLDAAWLAEAELVFVSFQPLARFTKHVAIPNFVLPAPRRPAP